MEAGGFEIYACEVCGTEVRAAEVRAAEVDRMSQRGDDEWRPACPSEPLVTFPAE